VRRLPNVAMMRGPCTVSQTIFILNFYSCTVSLTYFIVIPDKIKIY
jgi:hypothetical protein